MSEQAFINPREIMRLILLVSPSKKDADQWPHIEETIAFGCLSTIAGYKIPGETCYCWLLCTKQSEKTAEFLRHHFSSVVQFGDLPPIKGIDSVLEIFDLIMRIAADPINLDQTIFCDCTGGTKTMSIAAALACTHFNLTTPSQTNLILTYIASKASRDNIFLRKYDLSDLVAEEQRRYIEQQERIGRLCYMARMSPILMHEIKNPLNIISANLYLLRNKFDNQYSKNLLRIQRAVKEISGTINNIQRAVRMETEVYSPPKILLIEVVRRLKARTESYFPQLNFKVNGKLSGIRLKISEEKLYTIFTNLIDNAARATKEKGTVTLVFDCNQELLTVYVEDDGPGIPHQLQTNLFKPMQKGKDSPGIGMGLSIVKGFIAEEGGTIYYDDSYNHGARFVIKLPIEKEGDICT